MAEPRVDGLAELAKVLGAADSLVAVGHVRPDGDALGAALAIALAARRVGKEAHVTFGEPFAMPSQYRYLDWSPYRPVDEVPVPVDLLLVCDTAVQERLGSAAVICNRAKRIAVLDHHVTGGGFGDVGYVDSSAAATAELAFRVIEELQWPITPEVAAALYTGIVTDTGRFQYSVTTPEVHRMTARLIEAGVRPEVVGRHVYEETPFGYLQVAGKVLERSRLDPDRGLVWSQLFVEDLAAAGIGLEDADGLIDLIRTAREAGVACLLRIDGDEVKGSLRSRGEVDVAAIAGRFGGGGHHNAAGFTFHGPAEAAIERIREQL